jgi:hypothetical protein
MSQRYHLYRHFSSDGTLLYVGQSLSAFERFRAHRRSAAWAEDATVMRIELYESRDAVRQAETRAIREEKPRFNIAGTKKKRPPRAPRPRRVSKLLLLTMRVDPSLKAAALKAAAEQKMSLSALAKVAINERLRAAGISITP